MRRAAIALLAVGCLAFIAVYPQIAETGFRADGTAVPVPHWVGWTMAGGTACGVIGMTLLIASLIQAENRTNPWLAHSKPSRRNGIR